MGDPPSALITSDLDIDSETLTGCFRLSDTRTISFQASEDSKVRTTIFSRSLTPCRAPTSPSVPQIPRKTLRLVRQARIDNPTYLLDDLSRFLELLRKEVYRVKKVYKDELEALRKKDQEGRLRKARHRECVRVYLKDLKERCEVRVRLWRSIAEKIQSTLKEEDRLWKDYFSHHPDDEEEEKPTLSPEESVRKLELEVDALRKDLEHTRTRLATARYECGKARRCLVRRRSEESDHDRDEGIASSASSEEEDGYGYGDGDDLTWVPTEAETDTAGRASLPMSLVPTEPYTPPPVCRGAIPSPSPPEQPPIAGLITYPELPSLYAFMAAEPPARIRPNPTPTPTPSFQPDDPATARTKSARLSAWTLSQDVLSLTAEQTSLRQRLKEKESELARVRSTMDRVIDRREQVALNWQIQAEIMEEEGRVKWEVPNVRRKRGGGGVNMALLV